MNKNNVTVLLDDIISLMQHGVENSDWSYIVTAYSFLTGQEIELPSKAENPENASINILLARLEKLESNLAPSTKKPVQTRKGKATKKPAKIEINKNEKTNKFDEMDYLISEVGKEKGFENIDDNIERAERKRKPYKPVDVICSVCNKNLQVHPQFAREIYTCDRCIGRRS